jgi:FkbM family methyltransferase
MLPKGYYSQAGQDILAESILQKINPDMTGISIVDIGANHPIIINNTIYFERKFNAKVESIEPNPMLYKIYQKEQRSVHQMAVGSKEAELELLIPQRELSDLEYDDSVHATFLNNELPEVGENVLKSKCIVKPLDKIIKIGKYNILFIDVEGFEMEVLNGIDFDNFKFDIIIIENNANNRAKSVIYKVLKGKRYLLFGRIYNLDDIYINEDLNAKLK